MFSIRLKGGVFNLNLSLFPQNIVNSFFAKAFNLRYHVHSYFYVAFDIVKKKKKKNYVFWHLILFQFESRQEKGD